MPFQVSCPGCNTSYNLADEMRGKAIRCKKCSKAFRTSANTSAATSGQTGKAAPMPSQGAARPSAVGPGAAREGAAKTAVPNAIRAAAPNSRRPGASPRPQPVNEFGLDEIAKDDVFAGAAPPPNYDPLANHVVQDPGFAYVDPSKYEKKQTQDFDNSLYYNPAVSELVTSVEMEAANSPIRDKPFWIPVIGFGATLGMMIPASILMLIIIPPLGFLGLVLTAMVAASATTYAEIWTLVRIHRYYRGEHMLYYFFWNWARIAFLFQHWSWMRDVAVLWVTGTLTTIAVTLTIILYGNV